MSKAASVIDWARIRAISSLYRSQAHLDAVGFPRRVPPGIGLSERLLQAAVLGEAPQCPKAHRRPPEGQSPHRLACAWVALGAHKGL